MLIQILVLNKGDKEMEFTFKNYKLFCYDFKLKPNRFKNLKIFKEYCNGNYDIIFKIRGEY